MSWRTVVITKSAKLHLEDEQLVVDEGFKKNLIPVEDIAILIVESQRVNLTSYLLRFLNQNDVAVVFCDEKHLPASILYPISGHHRSVQILDLQIKASEPFRKRIWQKVIQAKVKNQADCLTSLNNKGAKKISALVSKVKSGDPKNIEALAARIYWASIFDGDKFFRRGNEDRRNILLNFGYSLLRSTIARAAIVSGLFPALGVHHASNMNAFNLVDDFIEPFRPQVDAIVAKLPLEFGEKPTKEERMEFYKFLGQDICLDTDRNFSLYRASELVCSSFVNALKSKDVDELVLPRFTYES